MHSQRRGESGQSLTEFAIFLPILAVLLLGIADFARLYNTMITVESAAREAADSGSLYPWQWCTTGSPTEDCPAGSEVNRDNTVAEMWRRACVSSKALPEYQGPDDACTNPTFNYVLDTSPTAGPVSESACPAVERTATPCNVRVTLSYDFEWIAPGAIFRIFGLDDPFDFDRTSTFAISDFEIDDPSAP